MLIIRKEQIKVLRQFMEKQFEDKMYIHLQKFFPAKCESLGETETGKLISKGIKQASEYEIRSERDVCKFIDLMFVLGEDFAKDPSINWASEILSDESIKSPSIRIKTLCDRAFKYQQERNAQ